MKTKTACRDVLHHIPQRADESRYARDYRASRVRDVATTTPVMRFLSDAAEVVAMGTCFLLVVFVWAALS